MAKTTRGHLFCVTAPSGAGKSSLVKELLAADENVHLSVSYTTRQPRRGEQDGVDYHFVSTETFEAMRAAGDLLEWAYVHGNYYGTSAKWIVNELAGGADILLEIDYQGARQVQMVFPEVVGIFILPPSMEVLQKRLENRATDTPEVIRERMRNAQRELDQATSFEYVIINEDFDRAKDDLIAVVRAKRLETRSQMLVNASLFEKLNIALPR